MTEVLWAIGRLPAILELLCLVLKGRRGRQTMRERRSVDDGFEDRPWLAICIDRPIELTGRVIASAYHRKDLSAVRVDRNQRGIGARILLSFGENLIELRQSIFNH